MKRIICMLLAVLLCLSLLPVSAAPENIPIDEAHFPDWRFRDWLKAQSYGTDGVLTQAEREAVTRLAPIGKNIHDLAGIEYFPNLEDLSCGNNNLLHLDVTQNPKLQILSSFDNRLTELDLSASPQLRDLNVRNNFLQSLDVSVCPLLEILDCGYGALRDLNVTGCQKLKTLTCGSNALDTLDLTGCSSLEILDCSNNALKTLNLGDCGLLQGLNCSNNAMTELNLRSMENLQWLMCQDNLLTRLYLDDCRSLLLLMCDRNRLSYLNVGGTQLTNDTLTCTGNSLLVEQDVLASQEIPGFDYRKVLSSQSGSVSDGYLRFESGAGSAYNGMTYLYDCGNGVRKEFYLEKNMEACTIDTVNFPDFYFRQAVSHLPGADDGVFTRKELAAVEVLALSTSNLSQCIQDLSGIENFTNLRHLYVKGNEVLNLDLSRNPRMEYIVAGGNGLENLVLGQQPFLVNMELNDNALTSLDLSGCPKLVHLQVQDNLLETLDLSGNPCLIRLDCARNKLTALDLLPCGALMSLSGGSNLLTEAELFWNPGLTEVSLERNKLHELDLRNAWNLEELRCHDNPLSGLDVTHCPGLLKLFSDRCGLTALDVTHNPELTTLWAGKNQLQTLDIRKNSKLTDLWADDNQLTEVNIGKNPALQALRLERNRLTGLDLSNAVALEHLWLSGNTSLKTLTIPHRENLVRVDCDSTAIRFLDLSNSPLLQMVNCSFSPVEKLLVSSPALWQLKASGCKLVALDLLECPKMQQVELSIYDNSRKVADGTPIRALQGFHLSYASDVQGGNFRGNRVNFTSDTITYRYFVGDGITADFTLIRDDQAVTDSISVFGSNMTLGNELSMNFFVRQADVTDASGLVMEITKEFADGRDNVVVSVPFEKWQNYGKNYMVKFDDISAKEMTDPISVRVLRDGIPAGQIYEDSVAGYALRVLRKTATKPALRTLIVDMLNYGAEAQRNFRYHTDQLASADLTQAEQKLASQPVSGTDIREKGPNYFGSNLNLGSSMALTMYFKNITGDMTATVSYVKHTGEKKQYSVPGSEFIRYNSQVSGVRIGTLVVADAAQPVTVTVRDSAGQVIGSGTDSIESYLTRSNAGPLGDAIMKFYSSAYTYFHSR